MQEGISTAHSHIYHTFRRVLFQFPLPFLPLVGPIGATCAVKLKAVFSAADRFPRERPDRREIHQIGIVPSASSNVGLVTTILLFEFKTCLKSESLDIKPLIVTRFSRLKPRGDLTSVAIGSESRRLPLNKPQASSLSQYGRP